MPTLEWIGKEKIVNHHLDVPYRVLEHKYSFDNTGQHSDDNGSENMIINGDNLAALKSLLPQYEGSIKCIYIDPPYNTGNEEWIYNDNVNDPRIKKWLGDVVGKDGEDLSRHDKWLSMMYPRLKLLQRLLSEDGCLILSISYHELHNLIEICKEIFATRQIVTVTVQTSGGKPSGGFNYVHEYLIFVVPKDFKANSIDFWGGKSRSPFEGLTLSTFDKTQRPNQTYPIFIDSETGLFVGTGKSLQEQIDDGSYVGEKADFPYDYSVAPEGTVAVYPITANGKQCVWRQIPQRLKSDWEKGYIKVSLNKSANSPNKYSIQYLPSGVIKKISSGELQVIGNEDNAPTLRFGKNQTVGGQIPTIWSEKSFYTVNGTKMLKTIFPEEAKVFDYPKPLDLIISIIQAVTSDGDIILDSFAGSGTTAHAVLNLNKINKGNRKFILIEMMDYVESVTAERVKRVITGYGTEENYIEGTNGQFSYYELGEPLLEGEKLNSRVEVEKIREYVYFTETKCKPHSVKIDDPYYLGTHINTAYYLCYEKQNITTLNRELLHLVKTKADNYVIYADLCTLSDVELEKYNITFKKIPRDISRL
ncbi:site-specific DNA-methyltransferase [Bacillus wiedmannii]|uniref:site-specific DNA-methyltransferase n=1 Tax=Bacillus wiedmannii TaxID=1890302 RepID=UPI00085600B9|nr:site-specific DNA-methyltransferase [Bacillus wiedmannii]SCL90561.1 DNA (Cytosine-5-)-methyltransferase [Bacillus wiedmannii]